MEASYLFNIPTPTPTTNNSHKEEHIPLPLECALQIFSEMTPQELAKTRLTCKNWKTFIDTHFRVHHLEQFSWQIAKKLEADSSSQDNNDSLQFENDSLIFSLISFEASTDFKKALELTQKLNGFYFDNAIDTLIKSAGESKEALFSLLNLIIKNKNKLRYIGSEKISSLAPRVLSKVSFEEALQLLENIKADASNLLHFGFYVVKYFPQKVKTREINTILNFNDYCIVWEFEKLLEQFSLKEVYNLLNASQFEPKLLKTIVTKSIKKISSRDEAINLLEYAKSKCEEVFFYDLFKNKEIYNNLHFNDLLTYMQKLPNSIDTYQTYRKIIKKRANSYSDFERGLESLIQRPPSSGRDIIIELIVEEAPKRDYHSYDLFEFLKCQISHHQSMLNTYLKIADECENLQILEELKKLEEFRNENSLELIQKLEQSIISKKSNDTYNTGQMLEAISSIQNHDEKVSSFISSIKTLIEQKDYSSVEYLFNELTSLKSITELDLKYQNDLSKICGSIANSNSEKAIAISKKYLKGLSLLEALKRIVEFQKKNNEDFLPLLFELRSLTFSQSIDKAIQLNLLKCCMEMQFN